MEQLGVVSKKDYERLEAEIKALQAENNKLKDDLIFEQQKSIIALQAAIKADPYLEKIKARLDAEEIDEDVDLEVEDYMREMGLI